MASLTLDEDILVSELRHRGALIELEVVKAASALDLPLLLGCWCHCVCGLEWIDLKMIVCERKTIGRI